MRHGDAFADIAVTLVLFVGWVGVELRPELGDMRVGAQLIDGAGKFAFECEDDLGASETLGDHVASRLFVAERRLSV